MSRKDDRLLKKINAGREKAEIEKEKEENKKSFKEHMRDFKDFCVKDTSRMILLVAILIVAYFVLNLYLQDKELAQIDLTTGKLHTLTDRSKDVARNVNNDIVFYLWQIDESSGVQDLLRQMNRENSKITFKTVTAEDSKLVQQFGFEDEYQSIVGLSSNGKISYINSGDLYTFDDTFTVVDLTEQKLTNSLLYLNNDKQYKVYYLDGKSAYTMDSGLAYLTEYLKGDNFLVESVNINVSGAVPEDCDVLVIFGLNEDLSSVETSAVLSYIAGGGDIVIAKDIDYVNKDVTFPNLAKVLDEYCLGLPNMVITEKNTSQLINDKYEGLVFKGSFSSDHEITRLLKNANAQPLIQTAGPIELDYEKSLQKNVTPVPLIRSSNDSNLSDLASEVTDDSGASYTIVAAATKTADNGQESRAVVFGTAKSFSDYLFYNVSNNVSYPFMQEPANATLMLNSFYFTTNQGELYSIRKTSSTTTFNASVEQKNKVYFIIMAIPFIVAAVGIIVCYKRRRLK